MVAKATPVSTPENGLTGSEANDQNLNKIGLSTPANLQLDQVINPHITSSQYPTTPKPTQQSNQLQESLDAYMSAHPGATPVSPPADNGTISAYKEPTAWENTKFGAQYLGSKLLGGAADMLNGLGHTGKLIGDLGVSMGANTPERQAAQESSVKSAQESIDKFSNLGLNSDASTNSKILQVSGDLTKLAPAILGAESTGGATFYLQGVGGAAKQIDKMKAAGVKFDNHSDELFIQGSGIINYLLGKSVAGTVMSKMGTSFTNDVVGTLSAEATKDLANLGANATAQDVANLYAGKALNFAQRFQQFGLGILKAYPKIGTEFAGANLLSSGLKAGVNAMNGDRKPLGDITGDEIANDVISPFYNTETPANGNIGQFALNMVTSPAAGLSLLHGATTMGMLFDKSPVKNSVVESLQQDSSPGNVQSVKDKITNMGLNKGWTDDEISNTNTTVDALADIASRLPKDIPAQKFQDATNLVLGRRQLESVLSEVQGRKEGLDPAIAGKAAPFESLLKAKVEQANDKLDELITDKSYTYTEDNGKYFKSKLGEDPIEISKDRYDLEVTENKSKPKAQQSLVVKEPGKGTSNQGSPEKPKAPTPTPAEEKPTTTEPKAPAVDKSMLDELDNELDNFKQETGNKTNESVTEKPKSEIKTPEKEITTPKPVSDEQKTESKPTPSVPIEKPAPAATEPEKAPIAKVDETPADNEVKFKRSKVQQTVYHGSDEPNKVFRPTDKGIYFSEDKDYWPNKKYIYSAKIDASNPEYGNTSFIEKKPDTNDSMIWTKKEALDFFKDDELDATPEGKKKLERLKKINDVYEAVVFHPDQIHVTGVEERNTEKPYYVHLPEGHKETPGEPVPNDHGLDLFVHNLEDIGGKGYGVSEGSTGLSLGKGPTKEEAIQSAESMLKTKTPDQIQAIIKAKHESGIKSPRGTVQATEGTDTKNTEAIITKATATVRKAETTSGNDAESTGVIDEIDKAIGELDKEIIKLGGDPNETPPEPEPTEPPHADEKKANRAKYEQELKDAKAAFMKTFNKAMSGVNPESIEKGIRLLAVYAKIGIHDFKEIARELAADLGDNFRDIFEGLKASYGAFASQEATDAQLDLMTDLREVRKATIDEFIPKKESNDTGSKSTTVDENTSAVDEGKPAGGTTGNVQQRGIEELPTEQNDRGSETGNGVKEAGNEPTTDRQPSGGNGTGTGERGTGRRTTESDNGSTVPENTPKRVVAPEDRNHVIKPDDVIVPTGPVAKFNANVDALFLLKKLEAEDRNPTPAEKQALAQFVGWGGLAKYLNTPDYKDNQAVAAVINGKRDSMYDGRFQRVNLDFTNEGPVDITKYDTMDSLVNHVKKQLTNAGYSISPDAIRAPLLRSLLSNAEYQDAQNSTVTAYYTEQRVINSMWNLVKQLGFTGGRALESSAGIGHILGLLPKELQGKTALTGFELDNITGRLLKKLYPQANITVGGFEAARTPQNSQDLVITNVPFGPKAPYDKNFPELSKFSLHNYFIAKNLKLLKPGGIGVIITSSSTMDSPSSAKFRDWVTSPEGGNSYLVGAIRLPSNVFDENAGTQVTSDIMVFQKKGQVVDSNLEQPFRYAKTLKEGTNANGDTVPIDVNEYYLDHPENMLGEMMTVHDAGTGNRYGDGSTPTLKAPDNFDLQKGLNKAEKNFPKDIIGNKTEPIQQTHEEVTTTDKKEGSVFEKGGKIFKVEDGEAVSVKLDPKQAVIAKDYVGLKSGLLNLINLEQSPVNAETNIDAQRKELNRDYDAFVKKHGSINGRATQFLNDTDIDFPIVSSLENISRTLDEKNRIVQNTTKGEILEKRVNFPRVEPAEAADLKDAINISLNYRTGLDLGYMARMLKEDADVLRDRLLKDGLAFENPDTGILETPEEYLSGYVRDKLRKAEVAAANDPSYKTNVAELKKVIPEDIPSSLISYSLGSSWIPAHVYESFAEDLFGGASVAVKYLDMAGKFLVSSRGGRYNAEVTNTYAAGGLSGIEILDSTLNNRQIVVNDTIKEPGGTTRTVKNIEKTAAAQAMQSTLQEKFEEYVRGNEDIQKETERIYNDVFNGQVLRDYRTPDFKHYPGANHVWTLRQHQKRAVSRGLSESTLFAHEVGSGKTLTIITTAMEMRRLGTARKPLIGVQNSTLGDFIATFKSIYPSAKILVPSEKEMQADGRKKLFAKIATGDWDAIILPHSQITMIPDDPERQKAYIREQIEEMKETMLGIHDNRESNKFKSEIKKLEQEIVKIDAPATGGKSVAKAIGGKSLKIEAQIAKSFDRKVDNILNFEQLGIDALLMDEAHKYKRLGFQTQMQNIKGIDTSRSQRSQSVLLKSRWIQEKTGGKNVNFYTGTPISNTMAEAWTMIKYLRPDILEHMGIQHFDQFAKTFGQVIPSLEQTGGGTFKIQSRFAKFQNLPEFITAFRAVTDVVLTDDVKEFQNTDTIPKLKNGKFTQVILPQSAELKKQISEFKQTLEWFDRLNGREKKENSHVPLVIYNKAKQASIDLRLLNPTNVDSPQSKANEAVKNALEIYKETKGIKGVQMIFSDMYQSPEPRNKYLDEDGMVVNPAYGIPRFNLFEDIKKKLIAGGVPADQIVIFTEPKFDKAERKKAVFADANSGKIRFLLGTTERMGVGVNAQQKLVALHHLDAPARPMDFEQRNGRIIRQGNENKIVDVLTYGVEKTLDSAAFQRLATKQKFINQIMKGQNLERVTEDPADEAQMTFDEMMAHLSDSPYAMQKLMVDNKLTSERMKQQNFQQKIIKTNSLLRQAESNLRVDKSIISEQIQHAEIVRKQFPDGNFNSFIRKGQPEVTEKIGAAADEYIQQLITNFENSPTNYAKGGFELNGVRVELEIKNHEKFSKETGLVVNIPDLHYTIPEIGLLTDKWGGPLSISSNSGTGLMASIRSQLDNVLIKPSETQSDILRTEKNIEQFKKDASTKFDDSKMIALQQESDDLKAKMIAEGNKVPPTDDTTPGGAQIPGEYIKDQSNIKPALDFLDNMKAKNDGKFMSTIVPIPPAVWNGAIDVMKGILKATNSTQKAIRIAVKYIIDRGGTEAQARDFESTMIDKMASTTVGKKATTADTDESSTEQNLIKSAEELRNKFDTKNMSPDEHDFSALGLDKLNKKELHRYIEIAAVLSVDPEGVLSNDVIDLLDRVANRLNPRSGTAVPPEPPINPPAGNDNLMDDDEPRRRIPKKEKLPMESVESLPEQTDSEGKPVAKKNYSAFGRIKDIRVRNLEQLKLYSRDISDMSALRDVRQYATSKSQSSIVMKTATDQIIKAVGKDGWDLLRQALVESRLRGIKERWGNWAIQIKKSSDNDIDDLFEDGKNSMMYDVISRLDGYEDDPNPEQTILGMISNDKYDDAREYMSEMFANAGDNVAFFDKLMNGKPFDAIVKDGEFVDPDMQKAFESYKSLMEKPFKESHAANEGVFSDALGPLDTYYPLVPTGTDKHFVVTPGNKYRAPENPNNKFATGQGNQYSTALSDLSNRLANAIRTSNKANAIRSLENAGLIAKVPKDSPNDGFINVNGETYTATKVLVQDSRLITSNGKTVALPARYVLMPTWLYKEVKPIFEDNGSLNDDFSLFGRVNNLGIKIMLGGPIEATSHSYRLLGGIVNSMPYMQEWAYKNGVVGQLGGLVLNNPFVKTFMGMGQILFSDISSDEAMATIQEMAKIGVIPEKTWQKTWSKEFAELTGAKKVPLWDWSPILYGKNSIDLKSRVLLYRLSKAMNPNATPEQLVTMQNELGNYTMSLQGELEKFVKKHGLAPFYSFGGAIYRSGIRAVFGLTHLPLTRPSLKDAFTTKQGAEQMAKLAGYKMAQLISAGIMGLVGYWALTYHAQTDKWPWEDKHSKFLKIPFPKWAEGEMSKKMFKDKSGAYQDIDFSFFNPFLNRGVRAIGLPKVYETEMLGGTPGQSIEAGTIQAINTNLSPYTSSPMINMGVTTLTGDAPYITGLRDRYAGTPGVGFYRKVNTFKPGLQLPANAAVAAVGINPLLDYAFSPITKALKYAYSTEDQDAFSAAQSVFNTIIPHLLSPHGNDDKKAMAIEKQQKAINTSIRKEEAKQHKK